MLHLSREPRVGRASLIFIHIFEYVLIPIGIGVTMHNYDTAGWWLLATLVVALVADCALYGRAKYPERRTHIGGWFGSGIVAYWVFGPDR